MTLSTQPYKGARDFYPEDKRLQKYMFNKLRTAVERFGYEEYDAPVLEPLELYLAKSSDEIVSEQTYTFEDRGGRQIAIRPEMTPTVSRMVAAKRQELSYPLRWYSIPNLWRYERPQRGRLREHWQPNVDLFGIEDNKAELEIIQVTDAIFKQLGATHDMYVIKLNSRKLMNVIMQDYLGLDAVQSTSLARLIDRMHKMEQATFVGQLDALCTPSQRENKTVDKLLDILSATSISSLPEAVKQTPAVLEVQETLSELQNAGITNTEFDITIMRGFDYYTGVVFEVFDTHPDNNRSMLGGGRYDGLVGLFGVEPVPTVGFGYGDVTLQNFLEMHELLPPLTPETNVYVVLVGNVFAQAQKPIAELRAAGLNVAVDVTGRKIGAQFKTAEKKGIHYVIVIGENELADGQYTIKNLQTNFEEKHSIARIVSLVQDYRHENEDQ